MTLWSSSDVDSAHLLSEFNKLYHSNKKTTWKDTYWLGTQVLKCPLDLWIYQELLARHLPDLIIETGTFKGGSARFLATVCECLGHGRVLTIDIEDDLDRPEHPRISYLTGSSTEPHIVARAAAEAADAQRLIVVLDSDHGCSHVLEEMQAYAPLLSPGDYLIVEDTNIDGVPVRPEDGPGPNLAVRRFMAENRGFERDYSLQKFLLTFNPGGFLRLASPSGGAS
jgi:cephalosporin hydroxylase